TCSFSGNQNYTSAIDQDDYIINRATTRLDLYHNTTLWTAAYPFPVPETVVTNGTINASSLQPSVSCYFNGSPSSNPNTTTYAAAVYLNWSCSFAGDENHTSSSSQQWLDGYTTDSTPPTITITYPTNKTYYNVTCFNFTASEPTDACWYNLNSGGNATFACGNATPINTLPDQQNKLEVYANDSSSNIGGGTVYYTTDHTAPDIEFLDPTPGKFNVTTENNTYINLTITEPGYCLLDWNGTNETMTNVSNIFNVSKTDLSNGNYSYAAWCNDTLGNLNHSELRWVYINWTAPDITAPMIYILSPQNTSYPTQIVYFNVSLNETGDWCGYSLDGEANVTMTANATETGFGSFNDSMSEGQHSVKFYCNDTAGNMNSTSTVYLFISEVWISSCRALGTSGVTYKMNQSVNTSGSCFTIINNNITLDCQNNKITYGETPSDTYEGVYSDYDETIIRNCTITGGKQGMRYGILLYQNSDNNYIEYINVSYNSYGIRIYASDNNTLTNITATNNDYGIYLLASKNNVFRNNNMSGNSVANFDYYYYLFGTSSKSYFNQIDTSNILDYSYILYYNYSISDYIFDQSTAPNAGSVFCIECNNITVKDLNLSHHNGYGLFFYNVNNSRIDNVTANSNFNGINISYSNNDTIVNTRANSNANSGIAFIKSEFIKAENISTTSNINNIVLFYSDNNIIRDSRSNASSSYDILIRRWTPASTNNTFLNVSYNETKEYVQSGCELIRKWYVDANITNESGISMQGMNVSFFNKNDTLSDYDITQSNGFTKTFGLVEYMVYITGKEYWTNYTIYVNDSTGTYENYSNAAINFSDNIQIDVVMQPPENMPPDIAFVSPTDIDATVTRNYTYVNVTLSESGSCLLEWNGTNETMAGSGTNYYQNKTNLTNGNYTFLAHCNDTIGNLNVSDTLWVYINWTAPDITAPMIYILSPQNTSYPTQTVFFNVSLNEAGGWCGYSLDGAANVTMAPNATNRGFWAVNSTMSEGQHEVIFHCNDTAGNMNSTGLTYFFISEVWISSCQSPGTPGVKYNLNQSVNSTGTCFTLTADDIILDFYGNSITGDGGSIGVNLNNHDNVTVKNGMVSNYSYGIHFQYDSNSNFINNMTIFANSYGIFLEEGYNNTLKNNNMSNNAMANFYFKYDDTYPPVYNIIDSSNIIDNSYMLYFNSSVSDFEYNLASTPYAGAIYCLYCNNITIRDLDLSHRNSHGILLLNTTGSKIQNVTSNHNYYGIALNSSSNATLFDVNANTNEYGIDLAHKSDNNAFVNLTANSNKNGISIKASSNNVFRNMVMSDIDGTSVSMSAGVMSINNTFINSTYDNETVDSNSELIRKWYISVNVSNTTNDPLSGMNVSFYNSSSGPAGNNTTQANGLTESFELIEYINKGTKSYWTNYTLYVNDSSGTYDNHTDTGINFTGNMQIDVVMQPHSIAPPDIAFVAPTDIDTTVDRNYTYVNVTLSEPGSCLLEWNGTNGSMSGSGVNHYENKTNLTNGNYTYTAWCNDTSGNLNKSGIRWVYTNWTLPDKTKPTITIISPINTTYPNRTMNFSVCLNEFGDWCGFSLDGSGNITMTKANDTCFYYFNSNMTNLSHNVIFSCNDTAGNMNSTTQTYFFINSTMKMNIATPNGEAYVKGQTVNISTNILDSLGNSLDGASVTIKTKHDELPDQSYFWDICTSTPQGTGWYNCSLHSTGSTSSGYYDVRTEASKASYSSTIITKDKAFYIGVSPILLNPSVNPTAGEWFDKYDFFVEITDGDQTKNNVTLWVSKDNITWKKVATKYNVIPLAAEFDVNFNDITFTVDDKGVKYCKFNTTDWPSLFTDESDILNFNLSISPPYIYINKPANASTSNDTFNVTFSETVNWSAYELDSNGTNITIGAVATFQKALGGLSDGPHNITVHANNSAGNMNSTIRYWTRDTVPPDITNVTNGTVYGSLAYIEWFTDEPANSTVFYGTNGTSVTVNSTNTTDLAQDIDHSISLFYLTKNTTYYYNVTSCDVASNCNTSGTLNFTTPYCTATWSYGSWSSCSGGQQTRSKTQTNYCEYPWTGTDTQSCDTGGSPGGGWTPPPAQNVSMKPVLVPGVGIIDNIKLQAAVEHALAKGNLSEPAKQNLLRLSESIKQDIEAIREMLFSGISTKLRTRINYTGSMKVRNFMVYEQVPKTFANDAKYVTVTAPGANIAVVEEDPSWLITFTEVNPGDELSITYESAGKKGSSIPWQVETEVYAESLEEPPVVTPPPVQTLICTPGSTACIGDRLQKCSSDGMEWNTQEVCQHGCNKNMLRCNPAQVTEPLSPEFDYRLFATVGIVVILFALVVSGGLYLQSMHKRYRKHKEARQAIKKHEAESRVTKKSDDEKRVEKIEKALPGLEVASMKIKEVRERLERERAKRPPAEQPAKEVPKQTAEKEKRPSEKKPKAAGRTAADKKRDLIMATVEAGKEKEPVRKAPGKPEGIKQEAKESEMLQKIESGFDRIMKSLDEEKKEIERDMAEAVKKKARKGG
ncbi:MAG: right-handed parallel beta-helix repeat-containing protein, partial [Candidatus Aenigmarchaeota archaeon]|nr:right-handed parallel beta-helix repeat-containing protein [Candidatus Aenigmarchaeota archaeon]